MKPIFLIAIIFVAILLVSRIEANEIGFVEDFSLARDRAEALQQLIPGTVDYYFYHCLHAQNSGDYERVHQLVKQWIKGHGYSPQLKEIRNRQALLEYNDKPQKTLAHIKQELNLRFDHQKAVARAGKGIGPGTGTGTGTDLPTRLDSKMIDSAALMKRAFSKYRNLQGVEDAGLDFLDYPNLDPDRRRDLLKRLERPDIPDLPELILADLNHKHSRGFGSLPIHGRLTKDQMERCLKLNPALLETGEFVQAYLIRLAPGADVDIRNDPAAKLAYLERLWHFAARLSPAFNSLKTHALFHLLDFHRTGENYDDPTVKSWFMSYLKIPRRVAYINSAYIKHSQQRHVQARLGTDFSPYSLLPPVSRDESLVRDYLSHYFLAAAGYEPYATYIRDDYLRELFAEVKIINGLGDAEKWFAMIPPGRYQHLKERVDLEFGPGNPVHFNSGQAVSLDLFVKNIKTLIVKVFDINTINYYRTNRKEIDTTIPLDGLVATRERVVTYDQPSIIRHREQFQFPQLDKPGVYVVEFIGNGKSSRAIIRKGKLYFVERLGPAGHEFQVFDDRNQPRPQARIHMAGHEFGPDGDGTIIVPYSTKPSRQAILLTDGQLCSLAHFEHQTESYHLQAGFYVDREALLKGARAQLLIRPVLRLNHQPISLSLLEEPRLTIQSEDQAGTASTKVSDDLDLNETRETVFTFQVPENLRTLRFSLEAKIKNVSRNKKEPLLAADSFELNSIDASTAVAGLHLLRREDGYLIELRGKNGETVSEHPLPLELKHRLFRETIKTWLKTDHQGQIILGQLDDIRWVKTANESELTGRWTLSADNTNYPAIIHHPSGEPLRIPMVNDTTAAPWRQYSLLELRGQSYYRDITDRIRPREGALVLNDPAPGDYELYLKDRQERIRIRITQGRPAADLLLSANRALGINRPSLLTVADVTIDADQISVELANSSPSTRVHLFATRYLPAYLPFERFNVAGAPQPVVLEIARPKSLYVAGRRIGDEYRYILERAYAEKYPGNMLTRPELLLNPWPLRKTETKIDRAAPGEAYARMAEASPELKRYAAEELADRRDDTGGYTNLDFMATPSVVIANLVPDANGRVNIQRRLLNGRQHLHLVAVDLHDTVYRQVSLAAQAVTKRDLRQGPAPDPKIHLTQQKKLTALKPGDRFILEDITTSRMEAYDSLENVYRFMLAANPDNQLEEFGFLLGWPQFTRQEKQRRYARYVCHELNFFLFHKDRPFFDRVIKPYLRHKKDKTFMDRWLLGEDLSAYLEPWAYARLNIVEKILLAIGGPDTPQRMARYVAEQQELIAPDREQFNRLVDLALRSSELDEEDAFGLDDAHPLPPVTLMQAAADEPDLDVSASGAAVPLEMAQPRMAMAAKPERAPQTAMRKKKSELKRRESERQRARRFFRSPDKTREWAENNYYRLPMAEQNADLVGVNRFWNDYAAAGESRPFLSPNFVYATANFTEMMLALAVLDLPFAASEHASEIAARKLTLDAAGPMIIAHKELQPADAAAEKLPLQAHQNYFQVNDRYAYEQNERVDKFVRQEFLPETAYGCQVVIGNPTSRRQKLWLLLQIPSGAMPLQNGHYTRSVPVTLEPYATRNLEYFFYFPQPGRFDHYPVQVARGEQFVTSAAPAILNVVAEPVRRDTGSWAFISQEGHNQDVLSYLDGHNLSRLDLEKIAFRMRDKPFFDRTIQLLRGRHHYHHTLWSYGIFHNDPDIIGEYLAHSRLAAKSGDFLQSPLLTVDPIARGTYEHLEYKPLVNARAHQLGRRPKILNDRFYRQYQRFLNLLRYRTQLSDADLLATVYYLLLQDRVSAANAFFQRIDPAHLDQPIQYDYLRLYLDFYNGDTNSAHSLANRYRDYPVPRWQKLFRHALDQLAEVDGAVAAVTDDQSREQIQDRLAATEAGFDFTIESRRITLQYQNLTECTVNYYPMDIELLFSRNPFMKQDTGYFSYIRPNLSQRVQLPADRSTYAFDLPERFHSSNLMIEIAAGAIKKSVVHYANALNVQITENWGQLRVSHRTGQQPLPKTYVKVYGRMPDGGVHFLKDGYTDLRGKFDYISLSTEAAEAAHKLAILVLHDQFGSVIREAVPPKR